ncbi:MAG: replicative DNA helicase [Saprospiraceae bacterium]
MTDLPEQNRDLSTRRLQPNFKGTSTNNGGRTATEGLSSYVFGKLQPQALPLEEAVLGALMIDREALPIVMDILRPETFYLEAHQLVYRAIVRLFERSHPVDMLTVTEELRKGGDLDKIGNAYYLAELTNRVASAANIEYHARILAQKHIQRELIRVSTRTIRDAYEDTTDVFNLLDEAEKGLFSITQNNLSRTFESMGSLASRVLKQVEDLSKKSDGLTGVPSGFTDLDRLTAGWQSSDLIILAARPGMGKTSFVLACALNAAKDFGKPVALFSLEMANAQLVQRLLSMESEIPANKFRNGKMEDYEWQQLQVTVEKMNAVPIFIDDTPGINVFELRAKCRRLKMQHDIQMVIIDYLQLMTGTSENNRNGNREQEISSISRALKGMAKELNVPVIALSQLSRAVETRGGSKRPQLSDLRESGAIEQDADIVGFIYRPEYYQILEDENGQSLKGVAEIIIAKHRNGALDTVRLKFTDTFAKFGNLEDPTFAGLHDPFSGPFQAQPQNIITKSSRMNEEDIPF